MVTNVLFCMSSGWFSGDGASGGCSLGPPANAARRPCCRCSSFAEYIRTPGPQTPRRSFLHAPVTVGHGGIFPIVYVAFKRLHAATKGHGCLPTGVQPRRSHIWGSEP